jgi:hypothetical protein
MVWYALEMAIDMARIALPLPCMVCIGNGMDFLSIVWYALEIVWYGMSCIGFDNENKNGMVCYGMVCISNSNGNVMHFLSVSLYGMHWQ